VCRVPHSVQAACHSATGVRRAAFGSHSGARREVQAAWAQRSVRQSAALRCLVQGRAAASHREHRAQSAARSVHAVLRHAVREQEQPSALAAQRVVADARSHRDVAAERAASVRLWEALAARVLRADEPAARGPGAMAEHEAAAARGAPREPAVRPVGAEVPPSALEGAQLLAVLAVRPSVALAATVSERARLPGLSADQAPPAPSKTTLARRGQIAKRKKRRSRAIPISDSSCPSLVLESCLSNRVHDASIGDVSCP
jgi:hypothetical protein